MQFPVKTILALFIISISCHANGLNYKDDTLRYEVIFNKAMLDAIGINDNLIDAVDVTPDRLILVSSPGRFYLAGRGGAVPFGAPADGIISSFAFTGDSILLVVKNNELCYFGPDARLSVLYRLPASGMRISGGAKVMYLFDYGMNDHPVSLYAIARGGFYLKLLDLPDPINAVAEHGNSVLLSSGNALFEFDPDTKGLKVLIVMPKGEDIISVAADASNNRIYFSTRSKIYALDDVGAVAISDDLGGSLKVRDNGLIVLSTEKSILLRIDGLEEQLADRKNMKIAADVNKTSDVLTNSSVIDMKRAGLSDALIISIIKHSGVDFDLSVDNIVRLADDGVSSDVIMAMRQAMKKQVKK